MDNVPCLFALQQANYLITSCVSVAAAVTENITYEGKTV